VAPPPVDAGPPADIARVSASALRLPFTGAPVQQAVVLGLALIALGGAGVLIGRRQLHRVLVGRRARA
jgi:hypothetical protein